MTRASPISTNEPVTNRDRPLRGIALMIAALAFFSCSDAASKLMTATLPAVEVAWLRFCVFTLLMLGVAAFAGGREALRSRRPGLQALRALGVMGSSVLFIMGLAFLPMAEATAINFISPILITALAVLFLREQVGWRRWTAALVGLLGVLIVIRPGTGAFQMAALLPLLAAASWAGTAIVTRLMSGTDQPTTTLTYSALVGLGVLTVMMPFVWVTPTRTEVGLALVMGLLSTAGHGLVVLGYRHASASVVAPFSYVQLIWAGALGFLVFGSLPDQFTFLGASIIVASGLYTAYRERVRGSVRVSS
jgi:drug/metabolite transporter (DMT)-like permease